MGASPQGFSESLRSFLLFSDQRIQHMKNYTHITLSERYHIHGLIQSKYSIPRIAGELGRDPTTIRREVSRGGGYMHYSPQSAQQGYQSKRTQQRTPYRFKSLLKERVLTLLGKTDLEPAGIGPRLILEHGQAMRISHMTIYRYIYEDARLGGTLYMNLRTARKRPKHRKPCKTVRQIIKNRNWIDHRPKEVDNVQRTGDLERDTIVGPANKGAIQSIVDRKSSFCWLAQVHSKAPRDNHIATRKLLKPVRHRIHSLTNDNGFEFAHHQLTGRYLNTRIWFCHPYQTNESARIEQINKLVRQYIPKKRDIRFVQPKELKQICEKLNNRPRKKLGYLTPKEVFFNDSKLEKLTDDP